MIMQEFIFFVLKCIFFKNISKNIKLNNLRDDPIKTLDDRVPGVGDVGDGIPGHRQELREQDVTKSML